MAPQQHHPPILPPILLGIIVLSMASGCIAGTTRARASTSIVPSGVLVQPYTSATFSDPALALVDTDATRAHVESLLHATIAGTATAADGCVALPWVEAPSLVVTRDVVEALITLDGSVPDAAAIAAWTWSRWHAAGGYFDDEYSLNWSLQADGAAWIASSRYSPLVATACALDILAMLRQPVPAAANDSIRAFVSSCHDALAGTFKGRPGPVEPTLQDAAWAIRALWRLGRLGTIDATACAGAINAMMTGDGLYTFHVPSLVLPAPEYLGSTIPATRLAVEALHLLGKLGAAGGPSNATLRAAVMGFYDPVAKQFLQDWNGATKTCLATADALRILGLVGFPAGFVAEQVPAIVEAYARKQLPGGGWAIDDGYALAATGQAARVVAELARVAGGTGTIDIAKIRAMLASSRAVNPATGMAAYCPYPANRPVLPPVAAMTLAARGAGLLDAAAEAAACQLVAASTADGSGTYPRKYPGAASLAFMDDVDYRTLGASGIVTLAARVLLEDALSMPFTQADLNEIAGVLSGIQYKDATYPGLRGLCLYRHDVAATMSLPGVPARAASLESTLAAVRIVAALRGYGNGSWFVPARFFDMNLLYTRLASAYRESGTVAWFEREYPASFQQPSGLDNAKLRDTRLAIEIIAAARGFTHPVVTATINMAKVATLAMTEPRRTVTDIDNAAAILALLNATTTLSQRLAMLQQLQSFKMAGSTWYCRAGLPGATETAKAWVVLSRFSGATATLGHVVRDGTQVQAIAGTVLAIEAGTTNCLAGYRPAPACNVTIQALGLANAPCPVPAGIPIPLQEAVLGPAAITVSVAGTTLAPSISAAFNVTGILYLPFVDGRVVVTAAGRDPFTAALELRLVNPDDTSRQVAARDARVVATGLSIDHVGYFAVDAAAGSGRYQTVLHVNPLGDETLYRLVATRDWCRAIDMVLAVRCADNLSYAPAVLFPLVTAGGTAGIVTTVKILVKRVEVTPP